MADVYRFVKDLFDGFCSYKVYAASGISTGDMMQWDSVARVATQLTTASGAIFLGVCEERNPLAGLGTTSQPLTGGMVRIKANGVHQMKSTAGETYAHGDAVYMGADAQTVTKVGSGRLVGRAWLPDGSTVTGATGTAVNVSVLGSQALNSCIPSSADAAR